MFTPTSGQAFNHPDNIALSSVSGSWTLIGNGARTAGSNRQFHVDIQGVFWNCQASGATLRIRDANGHEWYLYEADGSTPAIDLFQAPITLLTPFEYLDSEGGNTVIIYGKYQ